MLIKPLSPPPTSSSSSSPTSTTLALIPFQTPPTQQRTLKKLQSEDFKLRHERYSCSNSQKLHHYLRQYLQKQRQQQRYILLLIAFILLQHIEMHECRQLAQRSNSRSSSRSSVSGSSRLSSMDEQRYSTDSSTSDLLTESQNFDLPQSKRAEFRQSTNIGQPEEIFGIDDRMDSNYDEYPMIVPKRAALLLDRLMVALHNALEKDREIEQQQRIGELNPKYKNGKETDSSANDEADLDAGVRQFEHMYGDDPAVMMDYDFKDLNSINRATGETFFGKNLQRRAKMGGGGVGSDSMALMASSMATGKSLSSGGSGGGGGGGVGMGVGGSGRLNAGRIYWRCYFNAITCF